MTVERERHVAAVAGALSLLAAFDRPAGLRLNDFHKLTGLPRSRIIRYLGTLEAAGFVILDQTSGSYELGPEAMRLGWLARSPLDALIQRVRSTTRRLSDETGATAFFSVVRGHARIAIVAEEPLDGVRYVIREGQLRPLHVGATGKILLAFGDAALTETILSCDRLEPLTARGVTDPAILRGDIEAARATGIAVSFGEATGSGFVVAAPVLDRDRRLVGALSVAGPDDFYEINKENLRDRLLAATKSLGSQIAAEITA